MLLDEVAFESAIVDVFHFCSRDRLAGGKVFIASLTNGTISLGHVHVKEVLSVYGLFIYIYICDRCPR